MNEIRVVIIDQSNKTCEQLNDVLSNCHHIKVVGYTSDRTKGLNMIKTLQPNVALIDIFFIKQSDWNTSLFKNLPVLILARPLVDEVAKTLKAISLGAVDFINKRDITKLNVKRELISKINNAFKRKQSKLAQKEKRVLQDDYQLVEQTHYESFKKTKNTVVAIGTSTGGPKALQKVLEDLPKDFSAPIFIVQHMPSGFTKSLAKRLALNTGLTVKEASNDEVVQSGTVYIAPGNFHMVVKQKGDKLMTHIHKEDLNHGHRPSVNILFQSIAELNSVNKIAVILTGMGKDGADGVRAIKTKDHSAIIIAESEQSAIIFGMPQAAINTNCVTHIAHIDDIGTMIKTMLKGRDS